MSRLTPFILAALCAFPVGRVAAQASQFIATDDVVYEYIRTAQTRGKLLSLPPTALPYTYQQVADALEKEGQEDGLLAVIREIVTPRADEERAGFTGKAGFRATSNGRLDPLRVLDGGDPVYPFLEGGLHWIEGSMIARAGFRHDIYWDSDPDGLDAVNRAFMRNDQSYAGFTTDRAALYVGRISTRWGSSRGPAMLLSDNARSFDALHFRVGSDRLALRSTIGELDSITGDGRFSGLAGDDSVSSGSERRWMAAHRLDWRPSPRLTISFLEAVLFSGPNTGLSLKYLNPAHFVVLGVDNRPKNDENNALLGLGVWAQTSGWTIEAQLMLDDIDLEFGDEPASFAFGLRIDRPLTPDLDVSGSVEAIASRSYNAFQPEGRWTYLNRGLAAQFSDYVAADLRLGWMDVSRRWRIEPYTTALWQGERDLRDPFRFEDEFDTILVGTVERTLRTAVRAVYTAPRGAFAVLDAGLNRRTGQDHVQQATDTRFVATAQVGLRWTLNQ